MTSPPPNALRQRIFSQSSDDTSDGEDTFKTRLVKESDDIVLGKTPGGEVFRVPTTHDVLTALFHPAYPKSHFDILNLGLLGMQLVLFLFLPRHISKPFFLLYFIFWRTAYDAGLGWILTKQSKKKWIVREVQRLGWLDEERRPALRHWVKAQLAGKMGKDYSFDELPLEYNTWLLFRQVVDVILLNDFTAYCMFAFTCFRVPEGLSFGTHIIRWLGGISLIAFNLWVKTEAHNVVKDYAWYWGDVFFHRLTGLVFNGVFELAPHPMYSVGYAGYYGLSLISGSYAVLFVSLAAHSAQFAFLVLFENPHIERMYGQRKLIAQRTPLLPPTARQSSSQIELMHRVNSIDLCSTPAATEGETDAENDLETETETEIEFKHVRNLGKKNGQSSPSNDISPVPGYTTMNDVKRNASETVSQHDLLNKYFRRDTLLLHNVDLLRASDLMLILVIFYSLVISLLPPLSRQAILILHFAHALTWCVFHCFGLGLLLRAQSQSKFLVRHYMKHYHYPRSDGGKGAVQEAFTNWKTLYNLSLCMTYVSFMGLVWNTYSFPSEWTVGNDLLRHTLGFILVGLHVWSSMESYEVLGVFGWFFGDFFMEDFPAHLEYTGIYRYLNNPEVISGAAFFGLALVSGSKLVLVLAAIKYASNWWFLRHVENPHMRKRYGNSLRKEAGFVKVIKDVASKNARLLETRAERHVPEIKRVAKEVKGTFDKVYEETADAVEEFLAKSRPRISEVMQETKVLLQQSRERMVITRVASDLSSYDTAKYKLSVVPTTSSNGNFRFHLGEPITINWQAPCLHSRRDWIGIYRVGANKCTLITKTSSLGMWVPVHDEEWDGDVPIESNRKAFKGEDSESGQVVFKGNALPWHTGRYEIRYHHDGKYNVMSLLGPIEIYVHKPETLDFASVRSCLMHIVPLCLDSDPSLIPVSCASPSMVSSMSKLEDDHDPDDFRFWTERQAKNICIVIKQMFNVEYVPEVIVADANLTALANRILVSKEIMTP